MPTEYVQVNTPAAPGDKIDVVTVDDGQGDNNRRQVACLGDTSVYGNVARVLTSDAAASIPGLVVRPVAGPVLPFHLVAALGTNVQVVSNQPRSWFGWRLFNNSNLTDPQHVGYPVFVKLFDKASAPVLGTDIPVAVIPMQAGVGDHEFFSVGEAFQNGIAIAITKGIADLDNIGVALDDCVLDLEYK